MLCCQQSRIICTSVTLPNVTTVKHYLTTQFGPVCPHHQIFLLNKTLIAALQLLIAHVFIFMAASLKKLNQAGEGGCACTLDNQSQIM